MTCRKGSNKCKEKLDNCTNDADCSNIYAKDEFNLTNCLED